MDVKTLRETLKRDYGIESSEQLIEAMKRSKGINISIFTSQVKRDDANTGNGEVA